jgi:hypothetical protein
VGLFLIGFAKVSRVEPFLNATRHAQEERKDKPEVWRRIGRRATLRGWRGQPRGGFESSLRATFKFKQLAEIRPAEIFRRRTNAPPRTRARRVHGRRRDNTPNVAPGVRSAGDGRRGARPPRPLRIRDLTGTSGSDNRCTRRRLIAAKKSSQSRHSLRCSSNLASVTRFISRT